MDEASRKWRDRHHRCRNCKYVRERKVSITTQEITCSAKGSLLLTHCLWDSGLQELGIKGCFCPLYETKE